jgi:hypothetical protein
MIQFLSQRLTILISFLSVQSFSILAFIFYEGSNKDIYLPYNQYLLMNLGVLALYSILAYLTYKDVKIFRWIMAIIILLTGLLGIAMGIFGVDWHQYFIKPYFIIFGIYFIFGGLILFRSSRYSEKDLSCLSESRLV